jgi:hypothetical protein
MSWAFRCKEKSQLLTPYTAYSLRIGGAIALYTVLVQVQAMAW